MAKEKIKKETNEEEVKKDLKTTKTPEKRPMSLDIFISTCPKTERVVTGKPFKFWVEKIKKIDVLEKKLFSDWEKILNTFLNTKTL